MLESGFLCFFAANPLARLHFHRVTKRCHAVLGSARRLRRFKRSFRHLGVLALILILLAGSLSPAIASSTLREAVTRSTAVGNNLWLLLADLINTEGAVQRRNENSGVRSSPPEDRTQREERATRLEINPSGDVVLQAGEPIVFTAVPFDKKGNAIHGLQAEWETSNHLVVAIKKSGQATAGKAGRAILTARAGHLKETIKVTVVEGSSEKFGGKKKRDSMRSERRTGQNLTQPKLPAPSAAVAKKRNHPAGVGSRSATVAEPSTLSPSALVPLQDPNVDPLPDGETGSLFFASNAVGSPPGRKKPSAAGQGVALLTTETNGNKNFTFALPAVGMSGRGLGVSISLAYNSQVWNKSTDGFGSTWMTYDVDSGWPATGWRMSLGQIEDQGSYGFTLTDADGTRHALVYTSAYNYDTVDGSFIHYYGASGWGVLYYPDGTIVYYGASGGGHRSYPTQIIDRNGNSILISYAGTYGVGPKISSIVDTLGRYVHFYYSSGGDLVAITQPRLGTSDVQTMRFYYTDVTIPSGLFDGSVNVSGPSSVHTLQYVYLPGSADGSNPHVGYKFNYSPYGMVRQITQYRGMTVNSSSTSSAGSVTADGTMAAQTTYDYPTSADGLTTVPTYSKRTDDWAGRTTSQGGGAPYYTFAVNESTGVSTVTSPDGSIIEAHAIMNAGQWNDGLVSDTYVKDSTTTFSRTHMEWEQDSNNRNPRVSQVLATNTPAGLTRATVLSYTSYNNLSAVSERAFTTSETSVSSTELRRTETTYVTSSNYINRHLLHLPSMVKVFPGGSSSAAARVDYTYDDYGSSHANMTARDDIIMHSSAYDPFSPWYEVQGDCYEWDYWQINCLQWNYYWTTDYDSTTDYRGNVTSVTNYTDAAGGTGGITHSTTYDIAGNVMTAAADCCQQKAFTYSGAGSGGNHDYAYVLSVTDGNPSGTNLTTYTAYDYNTGLIDTTTDANGQVTTNSYNSDSLRLDHVTHPDGGATYLTYSDGLGADANSSYHFYVEKAVKLDNNGSGGAARYRTSRSYFDGRGGLARMMVYQGSTDGWATQDIEYDTMGRAYRSSNPYYVSAYSASPITSSSMFWTTRTFDHFGRVQQVDMPRGDDNNALLTSVTTDYDVSDSNHDGIYTIVTDQANKVRRAKTDAMGHIVRLDEPTSSGLGSLTSPNQPTYYYFDVLDNLVRINQPDTPNSINQDRYFKYDSLGRLIRERQVEQGTNSSYDLSDSLTGNSSWSRKIVYNSSGLVTDAYDARGVHTTYSYDDLNRITTVANSDSTPTLHYYYDSQSLPSGAPSYTHSNTTGRLLAMTYGSGANGNYLAYDTMGRVTTQKQVTGSTAYGLSYTYNHAGLLTGETYPSSRALSYSYDVGGRLSSMGDGTTTFANTFTYGPHGGLTSETWGNTAVHTMTYNRRLQPSQVKLAMSTTVLQQYDYSYGSFNTSSGEVDTTKNNGQIGKVLGTIGSTAQWNQGFSYDELGRVSTVTEHSGSSMSTQTYTQAYTYDRYGNRRQSANSTLGLPAITASEINSATNKFISSGSTPSAYDAAGNITQDTKFRAMDYTYDANGRMTTATRIDGTDSQLSVYDCLGQRVRTSANNITRTMVYDIFGQLVADYLGSSGGTLERENIYRGADLLAVYESAGSCYKSMSDFVAAFYSGMLQRSPYSSETDYWVPLLTQAQAQGQGQLIAAAQSLGSTIFNSSEYSGLGKSNAQVITDLYWGYLQRAPDSSGYTFWLGQLNGGATRASIRQAFAVCSEFQENVVALCMTTSSTSATLKYVLSDTQGNTRALMNNNGGSSAVVSRHDFLPFGEELWAGRSTTYAYFATDAVRQKYGLNERDDATGLDHAWFRKYESFSGRWTSPDPYRGSMSVDDPQSFNRYSYTQNDPVNHVDPSGLYFVQSCAWWATFDVTDPGNPIQISEPYLVCNIFWVPESYAPVGGGEPVGGGGPGGGPIAGPQYTPEQVKAATAHCTDKYFNVTLNSLDQSTKGGFGNFNGTDQDKPAGEGNIDIRNDAKSFSKAQLGKKLAKYHPGYNGAPVFGMAVDDAAGGYSPYKNYSGNDMKASESTLEGVDAYVDTQIFELGNSLNMIKSKNNLPVRASQREAGKQMEDCVRDYLKTH